MKKFVLILSAALALTATAQDANTRLNNLEKKVFGEVQAKPVVAVTPTEEMLKVQSDARLAQQIQQLRQQHAREAALTNSLRDPSKRTNGPNAELIAKIRKQHEGDKAAKEAAKAAAVAAVANATNATAVVTDPKGNGGKQGRTNAPAGKGK